MFWLLITIIQLVNIQSSWITRRIISGCLILLELTQYRIQFICKQKLVVQILKRLELIYLLSDLSVGTSAHKVSELLLALEWCCNTRKSACSFTNCFSLVSRSFHHSFLFKKRKNICLSLEKERKIIFICC